QHLFAGAAAAKAFRDTQVQHVRFTCAHAHDAVANHLTLRAHHAADVADPQAVAKDSLAPGKLVGGALDRHDLTDVSTAHGPDEEFSGGAEKLRCGGHRALGPG